MNPRKSEVAVVVERAVVAVADQEVAVERVAEVDIAVVRAPAQEHAVEAVHAVDEEVPVVVVIAGDLVLVPIIAFLARGLDHRHQVIAGDAVATGRIVAVAENNKDLVY